MADRFFPNEMPDYIPESSIITSSTLETGDSLKKLLHLPYKSVCEILKNSALQLKDAVDFFLCFSGFVFVIYFKAQVVVSICGLSFKCSEFQGAH